MMIIVSDTPTLHYPQTVITAAVQSKSVVQGRITGIRTVIRRKVVFPYCKTVFRIAIIQQRR
ncbi:hypothetical protein DPMN_100820 [Dreissena polymorpha]|uniref:Uncharacterized protein n=1 Tax=Dreissena polymorpha TaxID=45954 RepID=A0A9D4LHS1_DREPO|nr:hypothetical protein DPMN_100820 [Dreissena polymorpha]